VVAREAPCKVGHLALLAHSTQYLLYTPKRPLLPGGVRHRFMPALRSSSVGYGKVQR
jgi:hypothetical protein